VKHIAGSVQLAFSFCLLSLILLLPLSVANPKLPVQNPDITVLKTNNNSNPITRVIKVGKQFTTARPDATAYDEQLGMTFTQDAVSLAYTVTAVAQKGTDNYGPAYL